VCQNSRFQDCQIRDKTFRIIMRFEHFWVGLRRKNVFDQPKI
jgi:hypothetical protein